MDFTKKPFDPEGKTGLVVDDEPRLARRSYLTYKNYQRSLAVGASDDVQYVPRRTDPPASRAPSEPRPSTSYSSAAPPPRPFAVWGQQPTASTSTAHDRRGGLQGSTNVKKKPDQCDVVVISDEEDDEPVLNLNSTVKDKKAAGASREIPLVCDLTNDGKYDIYLSETANSRTSSVNSNAKVAHWIQNQGSTASVQTVPRILPKPVSSTLQTTMNNVSQVMKAFGADQPQPPVISNPQPSLVLTVKAPTPERSRPIMTADLQKFLSPGPAPASTAARPVATRDTFRIVGSNAVPVATVLPMTQPAPVRLVQSATLVAVAGPMSNNTQQPGHPSAQQSCTCPAPPTSAQTVSSVHPPQTKAGIQGTSGEQRTPVSAADSPVIVID